MTLVDSSVWIDYFRGRETRETTLLESLLGTRTVLIGDLMLMEVLQGFRDDRQFREAKNMLSRFPVVELGGQDIAIKAAQNYRRLRKRGLTVRKSIDTLIATRCIEDGHVLLHADKDFEPFERHLGLKVA